MGAAVAKRRRATGVAVDVRLAADAAGARTTKVLVVGPPGVGKSCVMARYLQNRYPAARGGQGADDGKGDDNSGNNGNNNNNNNGNNNDNNNNNSNNNSGGDGAPAAPRDVEIGLKLVSTAGAPVLLELWNVPGAHLEAMRARFVRDAVAALIVVDATDATSFLAIPEWMALFEPAGVPAVLLVNKSDDPRNDFKQSDLDGLLDRYGLEAASLVSARLDVGIDSAVSEVIRSFVLPLAE